MENPFYELIDREESLVYRGYDYNDVQRLCYFNDKMVHEITKKIFDDLVSNCYRVNNPICISLGGQPGSGKSVYAHHLKSDYKDNNIVIICLDNYRSYHPNYLKIEELIKNHWQDRIETNNDSMGNDIADFTHHFASVITDELYLMLSEIVDNKGYNIIFDWGLRSPIEPLKIMEELHNKGYQNKVIFIVVSENISREACKLRSDVMKSKEHLIRRVCDNFHDLCVNALPNSAESILTNGLNKKIIDNFVLINRNNDILWNTNNKESLKKIYYEYLHNNIKFINNIDDMLISYDEESKGFQ